MPETEMEDVDSFRQRARAWLAANMPRQVGPIVRPAQDIRVWDRARVLQRMLHDGGFAGLCYPKAYGGQGLSPAHQRVFNEECAGYEMPLALNVPTLTILAPTLLDFGTEEQKLRHLPAILRGEEIWVQFLSEPTGGSDLAGALTRATRDGDVWILNGSKIWSTYAHASDYAMCLARTNWEVPKHRGLTMFLLEIHQPGIHIDQIRQVDGTMEFCQEFFDDVAIPEADVIGAVNDGWTVASRLLYHERNAVGRGSEYASGGDVDPEARAGGPTMADIARRAGRAQDPYVRQLVAEEHINAVVQSQLIDRVTHGIRTGVFPSTAGAILRLMNGVNATRRTDIGLEIAGRAAVVGPEGDERLSLGVQFINRQASCLGGGSTEMQRNIISERVLGMPRDAGNSKEPFSQVRHNTMVKRGS